MNAPSRPWFGRHRFERILVRVDTALLGDEIPWHALDRIGRLALEQGARVHLVDVLEALPAVVADDPVAQRVAALAEARARARLQALAAPLATCATPTVEVLHGTPFLVATRLVLRDRHDLLIHLTHLADAAGGLGSDDRHLARKCPCPVWIMDAASDRPYRTIVVAVEQDLDKEDDALDNFALQLSQTAAQFAALDGAELHLVHAWQVFGAGLLDETGLTLDVTTRAAYVAAQRRHHHRWLQAVRHGLGDRLGQRISVHLLEGPAAQVVPRHLAEVSADLFVMGTVAGGNTPGLFIGNSAEDILGRVAVPLLVLKPPGFASPVRAAPATTLSIQPGVPV